MNHLHPELFRRHKLNPILTAADWPYPINSVFNAGVALMPDGTTLLLCRCEDRRGHSHLCVARSANGIDDWQIDPQPTMPADPEHHPEELWGIEDPRIETRGAAFDEPIDTNKTAAGRAKNRRIEFKVLG